MRKILIAAVVLVAVIVVGGLAVRSVLFQKPSVSMEELFPQKTALYLDVNAKQSGPQAENLNTIWKAIQSQPGFDAAWDRLNQQAKKKASLDFGRDIAPLWDGELGVSLFSEGGKPGFMLAASSTKPTELVDKMVKAAETPPTTESYAGTTIYKTSGKEPAYAAVAGRFVVLTSDKSALQRAIDYTQKGGDKAATFAGNAGYQAMAKSLPTLRFGTGYMDGSQLQGMMSKLPGAQPEILQAFSTSGIEKSQMGLALMADPDGLKVVMEGKGPPELVPALLANPGKVVGILPQDTLAFVSGYDLAGAMARAKKQQPTAFGDFYRQAEAFSGINVEKDLLSWMDGEYALAVLQRKMAIPMGPEVPTVLALWAVKDQSAVLQGLKKVEGAIAEAGLSFESQSVGGVDVREASVMPGAGLSYGITDGWLFVTTAKPADVIGVIQKKASSLDANPAFHKVQKQLPTPNTGTFYWDVQATRQLVEGYIPAAERKTYEEEAKPFLTAIKAIAAGSSPSKEGESHGLLFVQIGK